MLSTPSALLSTAKKSLSQMMVARKIVAVLGASYGGCHTAQLLAAHLPEDWSILLVDRNDHFNHLYVFPRFSVLPEHAYKGFIPYINVFRLPELPAGAAGSSTDSPLTPPPMGTQGPPREIFLHASVTSLTTNTFTLSRAFPEYGLGTEVKYDYLVYALGGKLPAPINIWGPVNDEKSGPNETQESDDSIITVRNPPSVGRKDFEELERGTKPAGVEWLHQYRKRIEDAPSLLVVGGGALGIQLATDIKDVFPAKNVTLLHSRMKLLPRFDERMHDEIISTMSSMNVHTILGERLDLSSLYPKKTVTLPDGTAERVVRTEKGREIHASMILLCTGQTPNSDLMKAAIPGSTVEDGPSKHAIRVKRSMQVALPIPGEDIQERVLSAKFAQTTLNAGDSKNEEGPKVLEVEDDAHLHVPHPHIFAIGDTADSWGAINAGHTAYWQGKIAAENIIRLVNQGEGKEVGEPLHRYVPGAPAIKVTLGLKKAVYEVEHDVGMKYNGAIDLETPSMWKFMGIETDDEGMRKL